MKPIVFFLIVLPLIISVAGNAIEIDGDVWGVWTPENNPYLVVGEVRVPPESTLTIDPGVLVDFQGHYKFIVDSLAILLAEGTESDSIFFTSDDTVTGWRGIRFHHANSLSQVSYCRIEYGRAGGSDLDRYGGGIFCFYSSPTITYNTIIRNSADDRGGGICCFYSNPLIRKNTISDNFATGGSGLFCSESNPTIRGNIIAGNVAGSRGGGIYLHRSSPGIINNTFSNNSVGHSGGAICCYDYSNPTISHNIIEGNLAVYRAGGIYCRDYSGPTITKNQIRANASSSGAGVHCLVESNALIEDNFFEDNSASEAGGAILCRLNRFSSPIISKNIIIGNSAYTGGGICCADSTLVLITGNTLAGNSADLSGGAIECRLGSDVTIKNTILWGDFAQTDPEIFVGHGSVVLTVTYSDIQGGWEGEGNIDADPIFVGLDRYDVNLRWHSPGIDAGDPNLPLDPDGTRSDIGAFYFNQDVEEIIELYPYNTPIVIPADGGKLLFDGWIFNFLNHLGMTDIWTYLFLPGGQRYGPLELHEEVRIPADSLGRNQLTENIPGPAPGGEFVFVAYVGDYPGSIIDSSYFYFSKDTLLAGVGSDGTGGSLPLSCVLSQNYPNPFNLSTTIYYQLPANAYVKLEVYNLLGQRVATLVDGKQEAGHKSVHWDASALSSGLYFYKLTAADYTETKRMALIK
jgi:parallel beta-helix repeat protein/predicted outer membrane repeat protein